MPAFSQAVNSVDRVASPRQIEIVIWLAFGLGYVTSIADTIYLGYDKGADNLGNMGLRKAGPNA